MDNFILNIEDGERPKRSFAGLSIADIHFDAFEPQEQFRILKEQFLDFIRYDMSKVKLDVVGVLGDLFDHKLMSSSNGVLYATYFIDELVSLAKERRFTIILLHGTKTHDADQLRIFYHYINDPDVDIRIVEKIQFEIVNGFKILCIPELYGIDESVYSTFLHYSGYYDMALMHGTFEGAIYNNNVGQSRLFTINDFSHCRGPVMAGHVHKSGCFQSDFYYCGSPYPWTFADDHDKGFFIWACNPDKREYVIHFEKIKSFIYRTVSVDQCLEDPKAMIDYINNLKNNEGIDYIRIKFNNPVESYQRTMLNSFYRNNKYVKLEFMSVQEEIERQQQEQFKADMNDYAYLLDPSMSDEEKFVVYCNQIQGEGFITVDKLRELLEDI